jgi:pilus assembly protein Flp/PilA
MLQDPVNVVSSAANFNLELVQSQLPPLAQESQMLSLYTNLSVRLQRNEKGATAVEYGIMVGLIAVVIIVAVSLLGGSLNAMFESVQCQVGGGAWTATAASDTASAGGSCAYPTTP